jgi:HAD superfamily hydrolase (TIGR01490 family)
MKMVGRPFAAFDIDGTLIRWQLYHALVDRIIKEDYSDPKAWEQIHESRMSWKTRSHAEAFKAYEHELINVYDNILTSLTVKQFNEVVDAVFDEYKDQVYVYTRELIKELKSKEYLLFAISGSQKEIVGKIADYYGFDDFSGSVYVQKNGRFTGKVILPHLQKDKVLNEFAAKHKAGLDGSIAVGDSVGDASMMEMVEQPIAFNPEAKLFTVAKEKGWKIVLERKNMVYELESNDGKYELVQTNA